MIKHSYTIGHSTLRKADIVKDLGIHIDVKMTFFVHILQLIPKSRKMMGFILRNARDFKNIETLRTPYIALVRSNLEFGMLVWNPIIEKYTEALERVQRHFLKYMYYRIFQYYPVDVPYGELLEGFEMESLKKRREICTFKFLYDLLRGRIPAGNLLQEINIRVPRPSSKVTELSQIPYARTKASELEVVDRACHLYNQLTKKIETGRGCIMVSIYFTSLGRNS